MAWLVTAETTVGSSRVRITAQVEAVNAEVDQRAAAGFGLRQHPRTAEVAIALDARLVEPHQSVRDGPELALVAHGHRRLGEPAVAERHGHRRPRLLRFRQIGQLVHGLRVDAPGLLHQKRNARLNEEPEFRRHRGVVSQRHDELRLGLVDHRPVIGVRSAAVLPGPLRGDGGIRCVNAENVELLALQDPEVVRRRRRVVVVDADNRDALRPLPDLLRPRDARAARSRVSRRRSARPRRTSPHDPESRGG